MIAPDSVPRVAVRFMREDDWRVVSGILRQGIDDGNATFETSVPPYGRWDADHLKICRFVAAISGEVVGWCALSPVSSRAAYRGVAEVSVYVSNKHRGRRVGRLLLESLVRQSGLNDIWTLQSVIMEDNDASIGLHISCGFRIVGLRERIARDSKGLWRNTVLMERRNSWI
ncbi:MAG: GNAT family N-acetyltransferase, partial [Synergistaceae bacterium]|nr:GNAT family N-acetyltransferase [Synergistaceae bacterium]